MSHSFTLMVFLRENKVLQRGWGVFVTLVEIPEGWGILSEIPSVVGVWIFSGTTHYECNGGVHDTGNSMNKIFADEIGWYHVPFATIYILYYFASFNLVLTLWKEKPIMALPNQAACCHSDHDHPALFGQVQLATICVPCSYMYKKESVSYCEK